MKPFDLERALAGDPVVTRDGRKVRIMPLLLKDKHYPVVGYMDFGYREVLDRFTLEGRTGMHEDSALDLFMAAVKHEGWVNIYPSEDCPYTPWCTSRLIYDSEESAKERAESDCIATVKIEWEE